MHPVSRIPHPASRNPLIKLLRQRKLTLTALAAILHPQRGDPDFTHDMVRSYLPHLSRHLSGEHPIYREYAAGKPRLNPTWRRLQRVLTGEEFETALTWAKYVRESRTKELTPQ